MMDRFFGGSDDDTPTASDDADLDDELFGEETSMDDGFDDGLGFADLDEEESSVEELERRIDKFEEEVGSMSSTVSTLKSENEQISEDVGEVQDNVRKLLDIYEMVTRGVNPFVDEEAFGDAFESTSLDVFDEADDSPAEELDGSVADADADSFFDDEFADETDDIEPVELDEEDTGEEDLSFAELKEEYESGDADWAGGTMEDDREPTQDSSVEPEPAPVDDVTDEPVAPTEPISPSQREDGQIVSSESTNESDSIAPSGDAESAIGQKPYLESIPAGYASDMIIMQWLDFLLDQCPNPAVANTLEYYHAIGWISDSVAASLQTYLRGIDGGDGSDSAQPTSPLGMSEHAQSLQFIHRLAVLSPTSVVLTDADDILEDLVSNDVTFAESAVPQMQLDTLSLARADGGNGASEATASMDSFPEQWIPALAHMYLHGGEV